MDSRIQLFYLLVAAYILPARASLTIPAEMLSPLGVPGSLGPSGMTAVKMAVGSRLLNMLGSVGLGSIGSIPGGLLGSQMGSRPGGFRQSQLSGLPGLLDSQLSALPGLLDSQLGLPGLLNSPLGGLLDSRLGELNQLDAGFPLEGLSGITARSKEFSKRRGPNIPTSFDIRKATPSEVENFFGVLDRVDANKCISRLVCEVGSNPKVLEGLGHNIKDVMSGLRVLEKNALSMKYRQVLMRGQQNGFDSCSRTFTTCDQRSYRLIRTFVKAFKVRN